MAIDELALLAAIDEGRENSYGTDEQSELGYRRAQALEAYFGLNTNPAPEGRSQVVDRSVYETVSVMLPSLVRIFATSSENVCKMVPIGPEDEQAADQHTSILNHVVTRLNNWEQISADWIFDSLVCCNGYAMAYWDENRTLVRETYYGQSEDQLAALMADENIQVVGHNEYPDEQATADQQAQYQQAMLFYQQQAMMAQGQPIPPPPEPPQPVMLYDVEIERAEEKGKVCIKVLPPEHCYVHIDTPNWTLDDCRYFEFKQQVTIAQLRGMGLDVPDDISDSEVRESEEDTVRDRFGEDYREETGRGAMRTVWARSIWVRADAEGDGQGRLYYVLMVGRTFLHTEQATRIPAASMTGQPMPHRHIGMAAVEPILGVQDIKTAIKRGALDNIYLVNSPRYVLSSAVNMDDFLNGVPGGGIRMLDKTALPGEGHIAPLIHQFAVGDIISSLEYFDQDRQNLSGASRYFSGTDAGAINKTASGTMALQNMASMRIEHTARMMAPAVEALFSIVQELVAKHENKAMTLQLTGGKWATVDPQTWRTKRDVRISVGVGAGNRDSMMAQLNNILAIQMQTMPMRLAEPKHIYGTAAEMVKLGGFPNVDKFYQDPSQLAPVQSAPPPEIILEEMKQKFEGQQAEMDRRFEAWKQQQTDDTKKYVAELQGLIAVFKEHMDAQQAAIQQQAQTHEQALQRQFEEQKQAREMMQRDLDRVSQEATRKPVAVKIGDDETQQMVREMFDQLSQRMEGSRVVGVQKIPGPDGRASAARLIHADGSSRDVSIQ